MKGSFTRAGWLAATLGLLVAAPATAGTLWRCDGADGTRSYVSKRIAGAKCTAISSYTPAPNRPVAKAAPAPAMASTLKPAPARGADGDPAIPESAHNNPPATFSASAQGPAIASVAPARSVPAPLPVAESTGRRRSGQVYSYVQDGVRHYTSKAPPKHVASLGAVRTIRYSYIETCFACSARPGVNFGTLRLNHDAYRAEVAAAAREFGVEEAIVRAIIHAESAFNPNALSRVGAQGLMQLMPPTARRFGVVNAFDPQQNIRGGVQYLAWLLKRYNGDLTLTAAGYNAGEGAVQRHGGVPPYTETRHYVERVGILAERYRAPVAVR